MTLSLLFTTQKRQASPTTQGLTLALQLGLPKFGSPTVAVITAPTPIPDPIVVEDDDTISASVSGLRISGVTVDSTGAIDPFCDVHLFETAGKRFVRSVVSDVNGAYSFGVVGGVQYFVVSYKTGQVTPDVAGVTLNTLTGA